MHLDPAELDYTFGTIDIDPIEEEYVEVHVKVECTIE
jgi:hypothetical protein